jgi:hypothetical protein
MRSRWMSSGRVKVIPWRSTDRALYRRTAGGALPPPMPRPRPRQVPPWPPPTAPPIRVLLSGASSAGSEAVEGPLLAGMMVMVFPGGSSWGLADSDTTATGSAAGCNAVAVVDFRAAGTMVGWNKGAGRRVRRNA